MTIYKLWNGGGSAASGDAVVLSGVSYQGTPVQGQPMYKIAGSTWAIATKDTPRPSGVYSGSGTITLLGHVTGLSGLTRGATYYMADAGGLSAVPGAAVVKMGVAISATDFQVDINISTPYVSTGQAMYATSGAAATGNSTYIDRLQFSTEVVTGLAGGVGLVAAYDTNGFASLSAGYQVGGGNNTSTTNIAKMPFATEVLAMATVKNFTDTQLASSMASSTTGYTCGGQSAASGTYDYLAKLVFSTDTPSSATARMAVGRYQAAGFSSSSAGYAVGGNFGSSSIEKMAFSNEVSVLLSGNLPATRYYSTGFASPTAGYTSGGVSQLLINKLTFASDTNANTGASLSQTRYYEMSSASGLIGYLAGGYASSVPTTRIDRLTFATDAQSIVSANLSVARYSGCAFANMS
jgi:hypothetical protein